MNGKKIIKPFDLEAAKNGAKIETRDGREVEILKWDAENASYPIEGVILRNKSSWTDNGRWSIDDLPGHRNDLVIVEYDGEDKDEKIRKALVDFFSRSAARGEQTNDVDDKDILAWLERQGKKSQDTTSEDNASKVKPKFQVGDLIVEPIWETSKVEGVKKLTKICTSIAQSRKLMELGIDRTTADMYWDCVVAGTMVIYEPRAITLMSHANEDVPAWSLAALLDILPSYELNNFGNAIQLDVNCEALETEDNETLIDLVVNMIIHLHELKML